MKRFLAVLLVALMLLSVIPATTMAASKYATVVGGWLRLRERPTTNSTTITSYYTGTRVEILGSTGNWYHVRTPDGRTGYMSASYLNLGGSSSSGTGSATVISYNGYGVRLRTGPSTGYRVIRTYPVGTAATVLQRGSNWSRISINGTVGYMMSKFLSFDSYVPSGSETVVCYATIWSRNGYGVRLRTGPGTGYSKIGVYSVGTRVEVLEKGAVWDRIRVGSRVGWMMNEFLNYYGETELTSVALNTMTPMVGDTLKASSIKPDNATARYEWIRIDASGSKVVGTDSTYTVAADDVGKTLQLRLIGTGKYTGTIYSAVTSAVAPNTLITGVTISNNTPVAGEKLTASVTPAAATVDYVWIVNGKQVGSNAAEYTVAVEDIGYQVQLIVTGKGQYSGAASTITTSAVKASGKLQGVNIVNTRPGAAEPMVGDVLNLVISPESATATYQWYAGDQAISGATAASYTVDESVVGKALTVTATGTANYTGSNVTSAATAAVKAKVTEYAVTVTGGTGSGNYAAGAEVTITANAAADGKVFSQWKVEAGSAILKDASSASTAFTMPAEAVSVTAEYKDATPAPTTYTVTVDGTVQGSYKAGDAVTVKANVPEGKSFKEWTISGAELTFTTGSKSTAEMAFTMPAANVTLTSNYEGEAPAPAKYTVTVTNGSGSGDYAANEVVTIKANEPVEGQEFSQWTVTTGTVTLASTTSAITTFTMPAEAVSVTAEYKDAAPTPVQLPAPGNFSVDKSAKKITWNGVDYATVYEYRFDDSGEVKTAGGGEDRWASYEGHEGATIYVRAVGDGTNYQTSNWSTFKCPAVTSDSPVISDTPSTSDTPAASDDPSGEEEPKPVEPGLEEPTAGE